MDHRFVSWVMVIRQVHHQLDNVTASTRVPVCTGFSVLELADRS